MPHVSIIIPTHNRSAWLREAIESVLATRNEGVDVEVVVVDDQSTDDTPLVATAYPVVYHRVEGVGASSARNAGIAVAQGDIIGFLDDDDVFVPGALTKRTAALDARPDLTAIIGQMMLADIHLKPIAGPFPGRPLRESAMFGDLLTFEPVLGSLLVRASALTVVGGLNTSLMGAEDWDLNLRIARQFPIGYIPVVSVLVRQHTSSRATAGNDDMAVGWRRFVDTKKTFKTHIGAVSFSRRLFLQRSYWEKRGWAAAQFMTAAYDNMQTNQRRQALRALQFAIRASPAHAAVFVLRQLRHAR